MSEQGTRDGGLTDDMRNATDSAWAEAARLGISPSELSDREHARRGGGG